MPKKKPVKGKPKVNPELEGFEIEVNEFGEIKSDYDLSKLYKFLDKHMKDKKLEDNVAEDSEDDKKTSKKKDKAKKNKKGKCVP